MGKKTERAETKKECPSCGLGVAVESNTCEFCGWDFDEEDEWILQIEKLERDLMVEKQKFEPGTVNHMIESTLRNAVIQRVDAPIPPAPEEDEIAPIPSYDDIIVVGPEGLTLDEDIPAPRPERKLAPPPAPRAVAPEPPKVRRTRSARPMPAPRAETVTVEEAVDVEDYEPIPVQAKVRVRRQAPVVAYEVEKPAPVRRVRPPSAAPASRPKKTSPPTKPKKAATPERPRLELDLSKAISGFVGLFSMKRSPTPPVKKERAKTEPPKKKAPVKTTTTVKTRIVRKTK